jgi:hypothetical protein
VSGRGWYTRRIWQWQHQRAQIHQTVVIVHMVNDETTETVPIIMALDDMHHHHMMINHCRLETMLHLL